jgi:hypothetical protein
MTPEDKKGHFPRLTEHNHIATSDPTPAYNCVAWALGIDNDNWWPIDDYYWPDGVPREYSVDAFVVAFGLQRYALCDKRNFEKGFEKIALYARNGVPTHAARQLTSGRWTSKLGQLDDIEHASLADLEGGTYGQVVAIFRRQVG